MKATASAFVVAAALLSAACGEGHAIFNVDVYSFVTGSGTDTVPYLIPVGVTDTLQSPPHKVTLPPGFGSSVVDSVRITNGGANLINTAGTGSIGFRLFIAADSLGALSPSALALSIPPTAVNGSQTVPVVITGDLSPTLQALFTEPEIWISIGVVGTNTGGVNVTGNMVLTALQVRVVLQDKIF